MRQPFTIDRRAAVLAATSLLTALPPLPAAAWCGETLPSWAYYLKWDENPALPITFGGTSATASYRIVGDKAREDKTQVPPVLVVGAPGIGYDYIESFEALTVSDRRIIEVTFAGTQPPAKGAAAFAPTLASADACAVQLQAVCSALKVPAVHIVAHGLGAAPALRLAAAAAAKQAGIVGVRSLTLVSPYGSAADLRPGALGQPGAVTSVAQLAETLLPTASTNARSTCIAEAKADSGGPLLLPFLSTGASLAGGALGRSLEPLCASGIPVQLTSGGARDIIDASGWDADGALPAAVVRKSYPNAGHLPFIEDRDAFLLAQLEFMDKADGVETNREFKFADAVTTLREMTGK